MEKDIVKAIANCQRGRKDDFAVIYDVFVKKIYKFIYYKTGHTEITEDLTAEAFKKALGAIDKFDIKTNFSAWLYTIARNLVTDYYRRKKDDLNIEDVWGISSGEDLSVDSDNRKKIEEVKKYLSKLSPEHREIVVLRIWEGLSYKEIAEALGKSEESCKMMFSRVIGKLRNEMPAHLFIIFLIKIAAAGIRRIN